MNVKFDFTSIIDRRGLDALAIDGVGGGWAPDAPKGDFDIIPMWVADMNFATAPSVCRAIADRVSHPLFGYFEPTDEYYNSIIDWHRTRNGVCGMTKENIGYQNGVLGGLLSALSVFCSKGDSVLVNSPVYMGFSHSLENNGYNMVTSPLTLDGDGVWRLDIADMEQKIVDNKIHAAIFCSPHNPAGRVWERWEIEAAMALFKKHDVFVLSDEIWSDIILDGNRHIPTQSVSEDAKNRTVALYAPSKTFNLAGLVGSYHVVYNKWISDRLEKECSLSHYNSMNVLSQHALVGAYNCVGQEWTDELCAVLSDNINYAYEKINAVDGLFCTKPQGTYMLFVDCSEYLKMHDITLDTLLKRGWDVGVAWQDGRQHGGTNHIRLNVALPFSRLEEAFSRLEKYVFA